jgi:hypothetical protein
VEIMIDSTNAKIQITVATRMAPEDIQPKDMVAELYQIVELPSFLWSCSDSLLPADELVRIRYLPSEPGKPFKVTAVCLPFVYTRDTGDKLVIFDTRQQQLVRLDRKIARKIWKRMRQTRWREKCKDR